VKSKFIHLVNEKLPNFFEHNLSFQLKFFALLFNNVCNPTLSKLYLIAIFLFVATQKIASVQLLLSLLSFYDMPA
jgi:hypothetical protein